MAKRIKEGPDSGESSGNDNRGRGTVDGDHRLDLIPRESEVCGYVRWAIQERIVRPIPPRR